jgi:hypothetical protein
MDLIVAAKSVCQSSRLLIQSVSNQIYWGTILILRHFNRSNQRSNWHACTSGSIIFHSYRAGTTAPTHRVKMVVRRADHALSSIPNWHARRTNLAMLCTWVLVWQVLRAMTSKLSTVPDTRRSTRKALPSVRIIVGMVGIAEALAESLVERKSRRTAFTFLSIFIVVIILRAALTLQRSFVPKFRL